ncbi:MAG TPA: hypothetical protein VG797_05575 [Phycisphaerales bacterium]|nr:hypothetical protein [Phycisphaerales bacterium]
MPAAEPRPKSQQNRLGLDYRAEAARLGAPVVPIIDAHSHINGAEASRIYREARELYGVTRTYTMTQIQQAEVVRAALGDSVHFIAFPRFTSPDLKNAMTSGFLDDITRWHAMGSRVVKFWCSPRALDYGRDAGDPRLMALDAPWRRKQMDHASSLGMMFMAHIADPDTWFARKYTESAFYGTKADQYEPLERLADEYKNPWIIAHMGGWPEDLDFLSGLLSRHPNIHLDSSATKWVVRELSKHTRESVIAFLTRWKGRMLFGSDIVALDDHVSTTDKKNTFKGGQASSPDEAFDLYASRYYTLRLFWESNYEGPSPIADEDLKMMDPAQYDEMSGPTVRCKALPPDLLRSLYRDAAVNLVEDWCAKHP